MKKAKVLMINLPGSSIRKPEEHCGLAFLKAYLLANKIDVEILDAYALGISLEKCLEEISNWIMENRQYTRYVGVSPYVTSHNELCRVVEFIKDKSAECVTFAGGHYASLNKERLLNSISALDAIIVGEGELSLLAFIENGISTSNIPGVYQRRFAENFIKRERIHDLDTLPFQDRYLSVERLNGQPFAITTSRGCYGECSFCSISSFYKCNLPIEKKQTFRSAKSVSDELHTLKDKYDAKSIKIVDDNFFRGSSNSFLTELVDRVEHLKLSIRLSARPNDITQERAKLLKRLGVVVIGIGVESADENALDLFNKGIHVSHSEQAIELLREEGITCLINFITFNPIIDISGLKKNLEFIISHMDDGLFHRINSHLWVRATDPMVESLKKLHLSDGSGFPYVNYAYKNPEIKEIKDLFDVWCNHNEKEYYELADVLMAKGIIGNEEVHAKYKMMLVEDVSVLQGLIELYDAKKLSTEGERYVLKRIGERK